MNKNIIFLLLTASVTESFFLNARDLRRLFSITPPKPDYGPPKPYVRRHPPTPPRYHEQNYEEDDDGYYYKDRNDDRITKHHTDCDNSNHGYIKVKKTHNPDAGSNQNYYYARKGHHSNKHDKDNGEVNGYRDRKRAPNYHHNKYNEENVSTEDENRQEQVEHRYHHEKRKPPQQDYKNKDYITGVLTPVPKIKNEHNSEDYFQDIKQGNSFFENLFKTEESEEQNYFERKPDQPYDNFDVYEK